MRGIVFLDRDGTLVENVPHNADPQRMILAPGAHQAARRLVSAGYLLAVASNQAGVALGHFVESQIAPLHSRLRVLLGRGAPLAGGFYCPHHPAGREGPYRRRCSCRKPAPGLLLQGIQRLRLAARSCWMIGDILDDVEAGRRAGCRTVLLVPGGETVWRRGRYRRPEACVGSLPAAAAYILRHSA